MSKVNITPYKNWAKRVFGENNFIVEVRNGEVCIDAWNPKAKCIGMVFKKEPIIKYINRYDYTK